MTAQKLSTIRVEKPWGRTDLWPGFANPDGKRIGEIWFDAPPGTDPELMVKYLFTSELLSIQVHPDDALAHATGHKRGKEEAWIILAAEPDSTIALGTKRPLSGAELRAAALDGSIEALMKWHPVKAGDVIYSPARTVHAIGTGLTLVEVQQNIDLTYRLYDYGRPRELHLDEGVEASDAKPFVAAPVPGEASPGRNILCEGGKFVMERWSFTDARPVAASGPGWLVQLAGESRIDGRDVSAGECWMTEGAFKIAPGKGSDLLFAYEGAVRQEVFG